MLGDLAKRVKKNLQSLQPKLLARSLPESAGGGRPAQWNGGAAVRPAVEEEAAAASSLAASADEEAGVSVEEPLEIQLLTAVQEVLASRRELRDALAASRKEGASLCRRLEDKDAEKRGLERELAAKLQEMDRLNDALAESKLQLGQLSEDYRSLRQLSSKQLDDLKADLNEAARKHDRFLEEMEERLLEKDRKIIALENRIREMEHRYGSLLEEHKSLQREHEVLIDKITGFAENSLEGLAARFLPSKEAVEPKVEVIKTEQN